ncbi:MAG TPA: sigma-70 family RNA polymerase sigma factor [Tissierellaceae bacterium]|nr:sigma-70 family RNA polymerase sigma factor [Tissierellaceae bacterium]
MFQELVKRAREGDMDAKEEIINKLQPLLVSSIRRYYFNKNEFEDLMQEGNLKILESIYSYDEDKGVFFLGYIKTMLKYMYLDKHKIKIYSSLNEKTLEGDGEIIDLLLSDDEDILEDIVLREDVEKLREKLGVLTNRQRKIVLFFYIEKISISKIADRLGISYRTVVNTKTRAIEKLRKNIIR